jgi:hypothetical protein
MVTNYTAERFFSYFKLLKNERRSTMGDHRLSMLSAMCMNNDIVENIAVDAIIVDFASKKARKSRL